MRFILKSVDDTNEISFDFDENLSSDYENFAFDLAAFVYDLPVDSYFIIVRKE